jgi:hypothetical protein
MVLEKNLADFSFFKKILIQKFLVRSGTRIGSCQIHNTVASRWFRVYIPNQLTDPVWFWTGSNLWEQAGPVLVKCLSQLV